MSCVDTIRRIEHELGLKPVAIFGMPPDQVYLYRDALQLRLARARGLVSPVGMRAMSERKKERKRMAKEAIVELRQTVQYQNKYRQVVGIDRDRMIVRLAPVGWKPGEDPVEIDPSFQDYGDVPIASLVLA